MKKPPAKNKRGKNAPPLGKPFAKGNPGGPGRKPGVPNKATIAGRAFCQEIVDSPKYRALLKQKAEAGVLSDSLQQMIWAYAIGRPAAASEDNAAGASWLDLLVEMRARAEKG
jgi:hypothetical protein